MGHCNPFSVLTKIQRGQISTICCRWTTRHGGQEVVGERWRTLYSLSYEALEKQHECLSSFNKIVTLLGIDLTYDSLDYS